jgi:hypothetical protein
MTFLLYKLDSLNLVHYFMQVHLQYFYKNFWK